MIFTVTVWVLVMGASDSSTPARISPQLYASKLQCEEMGMGVDRFIPKGIHACIKTEAEVRI